jgi:glycerol-1-phosphate dehydrogenase [NAD(P)+]
MGEHSISHFIDTFAEPHPRTLHGEQVGVATWTMGRLQALMLASAEAPVLAPLSLDPALFERRYGRFAPSCLEAASRKPFDPAGAERLNQRLGTAWPEIRKRLGAVMLPLAEMERVMHAAGVPMRAETLGIDPGLYRRAVGHAHEIRDRYGFLDLAAQAGRLEGFAAEEG